MFTRTKRARTILAAIGFAATVTTAFAAEPGPPVYVVEENDVTNPELAREYASKVPPIVAAFGGEYVARVGKTASFVGEPPKRIVIIRFESLEKAQAWYHSAENQALVPLRDKAMKKRAYVVEGVPAP